MDLDVNLNSYTEVREALAKFVEANKSQYPILSQHPNSIFNQELDILAGAIALNNYKYEKNREETYLYSAKMYSSIYERAKELSYNVHRASCPVLGATTLVDMRLGKGEVVGNLVSRGKEYSIVHFNEDKFYTAGSEIELVVGVYTEYELSVNDTDYTKQVLFVVEPELENYQVDNNYYTLYINNNKTEVTKINEDYTISEVATEFTTKNGGIEVWVGEHNNDTKYGVPTQSGDKLKLKYMLTDGRMGNIHNIVRGNLQVTNTAIADIQVKFEGHDPEPTDKIARLAPLLYSTAKRAVTLKDHEIISNMFPLMHDCYAVMDTSKCCTIMLNYLKVGSNKDILTFTEYEVQMLDKFLEPYTLGINIELFPVTNRVLDYTFYIFLKKGIRPLNDDTGLFERKLSKDVEDICRQKNLRLGVYFTIGELLAEIYKLNPLVDGYVVNNDSGLEVPPSTVIQTQKNEYAYIIPTVKVIADNQRSLLDG